MFAKLLAATILLTIAGAAQQPAFKPTHVAINSGGKGPDVVLIPGLSSSIKVWETEVPKLLPNHRLHVVQVDGFAGTPPGANAGMKSGLIQAIVDDIDHYLKANDVKSAIVIGHSMGGFIGLELAEQHPEDVGKLVIVDTLPFFPVLMGKDSPKEAHDSAYEMRQKTLEASKQEWLQQGAGAGAQMAMNKDGQQKVGLWAANSDQKVSGEALYEIMTTDARPGLSKLTIPVLVLWPYNSDEGKESDIQKIYAKQWSGAPNVKLVKVDNSRHFIMLDQPEVFDREVQAFIK